MRTLARRFNYAVRHVQARIGQRGRAGRVDPGGRYVGAHSFGLRFQIGIYAIRIVAGCHDRSIAHADI